MVTIKPTPSNNGIILQVQAPEGSSAREITITERDGWDTLLGVLRRLTDTTPLTSQQTINQAKATQNLIWVPGQEVRFAPPQGNAWRDLSCFPKSADFISVKVVGSQHKDWVSCQLSNGKTASLPTRYLQHPTKKFTASGKQIITLEDLGL